MVLAFSHFMHSSCSACNSFHEDYGIQGKGPVSNIDVVPWDKQTFYINKFYYDPLSIHYECLDD